MAVSRAGASSAASDGADVGWSRSGWRGVSFSGALEDGRNIQGEWSGMRVWVSRRWYSGIVVVGAVSARGDCR